MATPKATPKAPAVPLAKPLQAKAPRGAASPRKTSDLFYDLADAVSELTARRFTIAQDLLAEGYACADRPEVAAALANVGKAWRRVYQPDAKWAKAVRRKISRKASLKADRRMYIRWASASSELLRTLDTLARLLIDKSWRTDSPEIVRVHAAFNRSFGVSEDETTESLNWRQARRAAQAKAKELRTQA